MDYIFGHNYLEHKFALTVLIFRRGFNLANRDTVDWPFANNNNKATECNWSGEGDEVCLA